MLVSKKLPWMRKAVLLAGLVSALAAVRAWPPGRAAEAAAVPPEPLQHDLGAENTHAFDYGSVEGKGGEDISGSYEVVADWPQPLHSDWVMGRVAGVYAESPDRIYVATTGELPAHLYERAWGPQYIPKLIPGMRELTDKMGRYEHMLVVFDRNGKLLESWEQWNSLFKSPNRLLVNPQEPERYIWIVDQGGSGVMKFTHDGKKLVMQIADKDFPASLKGRFQSQDMAWMPNGDFYVTGGSTVVKFSKEGKYLSEFGKKGRGPGELNGTHGIVIDAQRRLYIADRGNSRIQVFDENGKYLDLWPNITAPYCIRLAKDGQHLWVSDGYTQRFGKYDLQGKLLTSSTWGTFGVVPGAIWGPHYFDVDSEGNLYVAEDYNARVQKFRPKKNADPAKLIAVTR